MFREPIPEPERIAHCVVTLLLYLGRLVPAEQHAVVMRLVREVQAEFYPPKE